MKYLKKISTVFIVISIILFPKKTFSSQYISPFIKAGIGINKIYCNDDIDAYHDYSYPIGYLLGITNYSKVTNHLYISNTIYYKNKKSQMYFSPMAGIMPPEIKYNSHYLRYSLLFGIKINNIADILFGYDLGKLLKLNIDIYENHGEDKTPFKSKNHPKYDNAICIGLAKNLKIKKQKLKVEFKYLFGLNNYTYYSDLGYLPKPAKHNNLQLEIGYKIRIK